MITIRELAVLAAVTLCGACNAYCETYSSAIPFDGVSAWVTGTRFACGANRDRPLSSPPPAATAIFAMPDGTTNSYVIAKVEWKGRHYVERLFTPEERKSLAGATFLGVRIENAAPGDEGIFTDGGRLFHANEKPLCAPPRPRRNLVPMKGQNLGVNTGSGTLPFPVDEKTILPRAAAAKSPLGTRPVFSGGAKDAGEAGFLEITERREGRTLTVDMYAPPGKVTEITLGGSCETASSKPLRIPYLPYGDLRILEGGLFRYAAPDWYRSNASEISVDKSDGTVRLRYRPKTDGTFNPVCERIVIALSDRLEDVLPEIPNPPSPNKAVVGRRAWRAHAASDRARDMALWRHVHELGIRNVCVLDHETMWRDGGEPFTFVVSAAPGKGGDPAQQSFTRFMCGELGYLYGPYNNYTDLASSTPRWWSRDNAARYVDGSLRKAWVRCYEPKPALVPGFCEQIVPVIKARFGFSCAYCDVHTAVPPWSRTDYDARLPGAGTFSQVFHAYGETLLLQRRLWGGPVWSEGGWHFMYAGLVDGNYARDDFDSYDFGSRPWIVDFDLLKIHPLEVDFGMGALGHFSPGRTPEERRFYLPSMPDGRERLVDRFIAATLAFGHAGYLVLDWFWRPAKMFGPAYCGGSEETFAEGEEVAMRSYFMTQAPAARYTQEEVVRIRYFGENGNAMETSKAILSGAAARNQIAVDYSGGTHVVVNGNAGERLCAPGGIDLPPFGYRVWTDDGTVFAESGDAGRTAHRFDYAESPDYVYIDGRGKAVSFRKGSTSGGPQAKLLQPGHSTQNR